MSWNPMVAASPLVSPPPPTGGRGRSCFFFFFILWVLCICSRFGDVREIVHALEVIEAVELVLLMERERGVERTASDEVAGGSAVETRVEGGVVFLRRRGCEFDLDVGMMFVEGGDDLRVPDVGVVVAPAFDLQRACLS